MKRKIRFGKKDGESEGFVWITFSDLLTTLFLVFMVIALWAISKKDEFQKAANAAIEDGKKCLEREDANTKAIETQNKLLTGLKDQMINQFKELQKNGICAESRIEETPEPGGFRIFQKDGFKPWFKDGESILSLEAQTCLFQIGEQWLSQINSDKDISSKVRHILIEGHANSLNFSDQFSDEENFLRNLELSQGRALAASRYLIEKIRVPIFRNEHPVYLRELMIALGKSSLLPVNNAKGSEDLERSKRLEFKVVLGGFGAP